MPELIHTFVRGKMNKDLDERLVPNGEYRDALNLEVATSEGSDVGTLQTLLGNVELRNRTYDPNTNLHVTWDTYGVDKYIPSGAVCIGKTKDATTEKIYWFIAAPNFSAVAEYDSVNDVVFPILVDKNNILNFSEDFLITGINILEGFLFFTDNQTEPKKIEISKFKAGSVDFDTHTQIYGRDFIEADVTLIKRSPLLSPTIYKKNTTRDGAVKTSTTYEFTTLSTDPLDDPTEVITLDFGTVVTLNWTDAVAYIAGDFLLLTINDDNNNLDREYQVRVKVTKINSELQAVCEVQSIGEFVPTGNQSFEVALEQDDPLFEFKFPRFAYRYKYDDNQFSTFSPFTEIAFIPGEEFEYTGADGYNLAMTNNIRILEIRDFITPDIPDDVIAVDILYKESNSQNIYKVDTIEKNAPNITGKQYNQWNDTSYSPQPGYSGRIKIETELISSLLPSNQILRSYDNVPRRALAQEITGNRIIFGNYVQNFNMKDFANNDVIPDFDFSIVHDPTKIEKIVDGENVQSDPIAGEPATSIKTMRTYQMGVVYKDLYGRTTPVFTNDSGGRSLSKEFADSYNTLEVGLKNNPPAWATHYQFYVKETSNEYYNLALDRFYLPEDGSVWLSFPSADRNKIDEESFLELKKQHDNDVFIPEKARYKVLAISNEAPDAVKTTRDAIGKQLTSFTADGYPAVNKGFFEIPEEDFDGKEDGTGGGGGLKGTNTKNNLFARIISGVNVSEYFKVEYIQKQGPVYRVQLKSPTDDSLEFMENIAYPAKLDIVIYENKTELKPEYEGRFFVKIYKDLALEENILKLAEDTQLSVEYTKEVARIGVDGKSSWWRNVSPDVSKGWFWDSTTPLNVRKRAGSDVKYEGGNIQDRPNKGKGINAGEQQLTISFHGFGNPWQQKKAFYNRLGIWWGWPTNSPGDAHHLGFAKSLSTAGSTFRFKDDPQKELPTNTYTIRRSYKSAYCVDNRRTGRHGSGKYGSQRVIRWNITIDKPIATTAGLPALQTGTAPNPPRTAVEFVKVYASDAETYSSTNPAIFETYPKEAVDLDLYYSASNIFEINNPGTINASHQPIQKLNWFNCYSFGNGVESDRIRDDFNATRIDKGPIVSTVLDEAYGEELKATGLIFSQIFNSSSGVNRLNQFIAAEPITKDLNPYYTSIQKLYSRDTNLITLCEDKCLQILANKDALFNADGSTNVVSNNAVLGQALPYAGEYGISKNPESFAAYGNRAYFTDKNRGVVLRLSGGLGGGQGLTEISAANMRDFFSDNLHSSQKLIGSYDDDKDVYNLTLNNLTPYWQDKLDTQSTTVSWKEDVKGWTSRKSFNLENALSLNNTYFSFKDGRIWQHGVESATRNNFYGVQYESSVRFLMNAEPNSVKKFKTLNYTGSDSKTYLYGTEGPTSQRLYTISELQANTSLVPNYTTESTGWYCNLIQTNLQTGDVKQFIDKEGKFFNYIKGLPTSFVSNENNNLDAKEFSMQGIGRATVSGDTQVFFDVHFYIDETCYTSN
jgi:hypothetical protein